MNVILSIKPEYCENIKNGKKKYEFRKRIFKQPDKVDVVYIYATSPVKKIIGAFTFKNIIKDSPKNLWRKCKLFAGIEEEKFFKYFENHDEGFAIKIDNMTSFNPIDPKTIIPSFFPPQSFSYLKNEIIQLDEVKRLQ